MRQPQDAPGKVGLGRVVPPACHADEIDNHGRSTTSAESARHEPEHDRRGAQRHRRQWRTSNGERGIAGWRAGPGSSRSRSRTCAACSTCAASAGRRWRSATTVSASPPPARIAELYAFAGRRGLAGVAPDRRVLPRLPGVVQDLEHGHRRRQHLHVPAGGPDDLAGDVAGRRSTPCRSLDGSERQVPADRLRHREPSERPAAGRAAARASSSRPRRCASGRRFAGCR